MKIKSIKKVAFHRNGVHGTCFYSCVLSTDEGVFLVTFETFQKEENKTETELIKVETCRALKLSDVTSNWRGDEFGWALNIYFEQNKVTCLYDITENEKRNKINSIENHAAERWNKLTYAERTVFIVDSTGNQHTVRTIEEIVQKAYRFLPVDVKNALKKEQEVTI